MIRSLGICLNSQGLRTGAQHDGCAMTVSKPLIVLDCYNTSLLKKKIFCFHRCAFGNSGEEIMIQPPLSRMYLISLIHIIWPVVNKKKKQKNSQNNGTFGITVYGYACFRAECEVGGSLWKGKEGYSRFSRRQSSADHPFCLILGRMGNRRQSLQRIPECIMEAWIRSTLPAQGNFYREENRDSTQPRMVF